MSFWLPFLLGSLLCVVAGDAHPGAFVVGFLVVLASGAFADRA